MKPSRPVTHNWAAQRLAPIAAFNAAVAGELQYLNQSAVVIGLGAPTAARYRRTVRELGRKITKDLAILPSGARLRSSVRTKVQIARGRFAARNIEFPDVYGKEEVLRDAIEALAKAAEAACDATSAIAIDPANDQQENPWHAVRVLAWLVTAGALLLLGGDYLANRSFPMLPQSIRDYLWLTKAPLKINMIGPVFRGIIAILQITTVVGFAALVVAVLRAKRVAAAEWLVDAVVGKGKDVVKGSAPEITSKLAPSFVPTIISAKALTAATLASGALITVADNQQRPPPFDPGPTQSELRNVFAESLRDFRPSLAFDPAIRSLNDAADRIGRTADRFGNATPAACPPGECVLPGKDVVLRMDQPVQIAVSPSTIKLDLGPIQTLAEIRGTTGRIEESMTALNQENAVMKGRLEATGEAINKLVDHGRSLDDHIWRLCFKTHLLADSSATLRNGVVLFGAGADAKLDGLTFDCNSLLTVPQTSTTTESTRRSQ